MDDGGDELNLLLHALAQGLELLVAPLAQVKPLEPLLHLVGGRGLVHTLEPGQIHYLVAHLHLLVQAALFGQIADVHHVIVGDGTAVELHRATVLVGDAVDDAYQRGLASTIGP